MFLGSEWGAKRKRKDAPGRVCRDRASAESQSDCVSQNKRRTPQETTHSGSVHRLRCLAARIRATATTHTRFDGGIKRKDRRYTR